jgi:iron complex outermembrane receptor protein
MGSYTDFDGQKHDYEPYAVVDSRLTWTQATWLAYIEANNLFDTTYRDYGLVPQPGRWFTVGFSISL